jgi:hypothetical protein
MLKSVQNVTALKSHRIAHDQRAAVSDIFLGGRSASILIDSKGVGEVIAK